ncbi:hypothetical protein [Thermus sp.]|uniref:hypothetical protein n=1 Tax=Thermus sp. TaxID=275 RepID=UPI003D0E7462
MAVEATYLTTSDVARRLGISPGTVRHYGEVLRGLGFPMPQEEAPGGEQAYLWPPELVELARVAYQMARASSPRLSFQEAVELILYAAEVAVPAREGKTIPTLLQDVRRIQGDLRYLLGRLEEVPGRVELALAGAVKRAEQESARALSGASESLRQATARLVEAAEKVEDLARQASAGGWVPAVALVALLFSLLLQPFVEGGPRALLPYVAVASVGGFIGWWMRG